MLISQKPIEIPRQYSIEIPSAVVQQFMYLVRKVPTEVQWFMDVVRESTDTKTVYRIGNIIQIPKQIVGGADVDTSGQMFIDMWNDMVKEYGMTEAMRINSMLRVWCHSHVNMACFASGTDNATFNEFVKTAKEDGDKSTVPWIMLIFNKSGEVYSRVWDPVQDIILNHVPVTITQTQDTFAHIDAQLHKLEKHKAVTTVPMRSTISYGYMDENGKWIPAEKTSGGVENDNDRPLDRKKKSLVATNATHASLSKKKATEWDAATSVSQNTGLDWVPKAPGLPVNGAASAAPSCDGQKAERDVVGSEQAYYQKYFEDSFDGLTTKIHVVPEIIDIEWNKKKAYSTWNNVSKVPEALVGYLLKILGFGFKEPQNTLDVTKIIECLDFIEDVLFKYSNIFNHPPEEKTEDYVQASSAYLMFARNFSDSMKSSCSELIACLYGTIGSYSETSWANCAYQAELVRIVLSKLENLEQNWTYKLPFSRFVFSCVTFFAMFTEANDPDYSQCEDRLANVLREGYWDLAFFPIYE